MSKQIHVADRVTAPAPPSLASPQAHSKLPPIVHEVLRSPGQPLAPSTRAFMGSRFGHDFANVRVHADTPAAESARALNAAAFTVGRHVVFGANRYAPATRSGRELLGHELAHTIQQRNSSGPGPTEHPRGSFEASAAAAGWAVANGRAVTLPLPACGVGLSRAPNYNAEARDDAQKALTKGTVWSERHYVDALLTGTSVENRPAMLAYSRALLDVEIEMSRKQEAHQKFAQVLPEEIRIGFRRNTLAEIVRTKSVREGLSNAEERAQDPDEREQIRIVGEDMKLVQDEFRRLTRENAFNLLDASSREIAAMLRKYGVMIATAGAEPVVHYVYVYGGERENEAAKWLETARKANTSGYSDAEKVQHRKDLNVTLRRLRALQREVKRQQVKHPARAKDTASAVLRATATLVHPSLASQVPGSLAPDHPELKAAKAALAGAWLNAERDHPVLAAYRTGKDDALEDVSLGGQAGEAPEDLLDVAIQGAPSLGKKATGERGGETSETEDMQAVVSQAIHLLTNILTAKLALSQGFSPFELTPVVNVTKAQMLIRRGTAWDVAVEELMRGNEGWAWAKQAFQVVLSVLSLFPPLWPVLLAMAAIDSYTAIKAYGRYGLDKALVGTNLDRAKALSRKTPSLAGFAWALVGAGLDIVGAKFAYDQAEALAAKVLADEAEAAEAIAALDMLGAEHGIPNLGQDVANSRLAAATSSRPRSALPPVTEEAFGAKASRGGSRLDRGKGARPFYHKEPLTPGKKPGGLGGKSGGPAVAGPSVTPAAADPLVAVKIEGAQKGQFWLEGSPRFQRYGGTPTVPPNQKYIVLTRSQAEDLRFREVGTPPTFSIEPRVVHGELAESLGAGRRTGHPITARTTRAAPAAGTAPAKELEALTVDPGAVDAFRRMPAADLAQMQGYNRLLSLGEKGILRPGNVSTGGVDAITAEVTGDEARIFLNDFTTPGAPKASKPTHADWAAELKEATAGDRLNFKAKATEDAVRRAIQDKKVYVRTVRVESSGTTGPVVTLGTPVKVNF